MQYGFEMVKAFLCESIIVEVFKGHNFNIIFIAKGVDNFGYCWRNEITVKLIILLRAISSV